MIDWDYGRNVNPCPPDLMSFEVVRRLSDTASDGIPHHGVLCSLRRLSSLPEDFCCSICMNVFRKPSMLTCGHSFCAECIQHWLIENISCPTCRSNTRLPIRNIALEQVVEEFKVSQSRRSRHAKPSNLCEETYSIEFYKRLENIVWNLTQQYGRLA
ncbi:zinc finger, C3HC4 type [Dictyocaulus viviparus]|uniref:Zinc finger, C3HC4 type n=1 Tax=Dictyocaulus viviparus TaxID=29172 RepID=A0A0D8XEN1_DICVI|nr:zinc finger, C3HC4 type [Dictyocaulus viviparus]